MGWGRTPRARVLGQLQPARQYSLIESASEKLAYRRVSRKRGLKELVPRPRAHTELIRGVRWDR